MIKVGLIGGTGLTEMPELTRVDRHQCKTAYGEPSSLLTAGTLSGVDVVFVARHGEDHSLAPHKVNYRANIAALSEQGVTHILAVNAVGGIRADLGAGVIAIPDQIIDYTYGREQTFSDFPGASLTHIDFTYPYDETLRQILCDSLDESSFGYVNKAVYGATQGPRLETVAEIDRMEKDGCDIVGMTGMPEAALSRELAIPYAAIALSVNPAAGRSRTLIGMDEIYRVIEIGMPKIKTTIATSCRLLNEKLG